MEKGGEIMDQERKPDNLEAEVYEAYALQIAMRTEADAQQEEQLPPKPKLSQQPQSYRHAVDMRSPGWGVKK